MSIGVARAPSPDVRFSPPGLRSLRAACAPPSLAPLAVKAGSRSTGDPSRYPWGGSGPDARQANNDFRPSQRLARLIDLASARCRLVSWRSSLTVSRVATPSWCRAAVLRLHLQYRTQISSTSPTSMLITIPHAQSASLSRGSMRRTDVGSGNITCCHTA